MSRLEKVLAGMAAVLSLAGSLGWVEVRRADDQRLTAIHLMAQALAECERGHSDDTSNR